MPLSILLFTFKTASIALAFPNTMPTLQPAMLNVLLKEFSSKATSFAPFTCNKLIGSSFKTKLYGLSFTNKISCFAAKATNFSNNSKLPRAPVGMCGYPIHMIFTFVKSSFSKASKSGSHWFPSFKS